MISARLLFCCLFLSCCEKSLKTLPLCCLFRGKVRLKKNCTKEKNFFLSETTTNTARNTQKKKKKKERKDDAREIVRCCCGNGAVEELGPTEMWTWDWCCIVRIF